ncbi:hypothetical protein [Jannaschia sp. 2305UL9-9]|uniref:hypothetical protein n=1 Tax=Jannaschia sp. 2305UL9-9 TaxID=3121638 RepID=UPI003528A934
MLTRGENPLSLSTKAARYGAVALLFGLLILMIPVVQGYAAASAGDPPPSPVNGWQEMRLFGWELAMQEDAQ